MIFVMIHSKPQTIRSQSSRMPQRLRSASIGAILRSTGPHALLLMSVAVNAVCACLSAFGVAIANSPVRGVIVQTSKVASKAAGNR